MVTSRRIPGLMMLLGLALLASCSRDPNVRKQKYFQSGQEYFQQGKYAEAEVEFLNAVRIDPGYAQAHEQLALSYLKMQRWPAAYEEFSRTVELEPENYQAHIEISKLLIAGHDLQQAQEQTDLLLKQWPNEAQAHAVHSSLLAAQDHVAAAISEMEKAVALDPSRSESYENLALLQLRNDQPDAAEANLKKAQALDPASAQIPLMLGGYYQSRGRWSDAEQQFRNAIAREPGNPGARGAMARLFLEEGKKEAAVDFLQQAKRDFPDNSIGYRMLGDFYFATGDVDHAEAEYRTLYEEHPKDLQVKKNYIQLLILKNHWDDAGKLNEEVLKTSPQDVEALVYRGQLQIQDAHVSDAVFTLETATKDEPENGLAHYYLGVALEKSGNTERAETEWREAVRRRPDLIEAQRSLAGLSMRKGDMNALEQAANQIITLQPDSPDGYALRAISLMNRHLLTEAGEAVRKAISVAPQSPVGYVQLGALELVQKHYPEAVKAYQNALERDQNSTDALRGLMNALLIQDRVDQAVAAANSQIAKAPNNAEFYDLLGTALFNNKKDLGGAETALRKSIELQGSNADALIKLGEVQAARGEVDQAIATYEQAAKDHPHNANFQTLLGQLYESKQDWNRAQEAYQKALEITPNDPLTCNNLANVMLRLGGNPDLAMTLAQTARRGMPDSPDAADTLGWVYYQKGAYQSAIDLFEEALKLAGKNKAPEDPGVHYHLGLAYQKTNQPALARQHLEKVLRIDPNYSDAAEVKKQLALLRS